MNIWMFNQYANSPDRPGSTRHFDIGKRLVEKGHKVTIFAAAFSHKLGREDKLKPQETHKTEVIEGVKFIWLKTFPYKKNDWRRVINMVSYTLRSLLLGRKTVGEKKKKKPDVIIGSSVHLLAVLAAYLLSRYFHAKFVMEVRDLWPQVIVDKGKMSSKNPVIVILRKLEIFLYRKAKKIITVLPYADEYISSLGVSKDKISWIPNGVDLERFDEQKSKLSGFNINTDKFTVMYLGAHNQLNDLKTLIKSASIISEKEKDIKFILIGDGSEKKNLIKLTNRLQIDNVEFRDAIPKTKVPAALEEANVLTAGKKSLDTFNYGISYLKLFDYMAATKPIVFSGNTRNDPVQESGCGLSIEPENPESLAQAILKFYEMSSQERKKFGHEGRKYVEEHHSACVLAEKLVKTIK